LYENLPNFIQKYDSPFTKYQKSTFISQSMNFSEKIFLGVRFLEIIFPGNFKRIIFGCVFGLLEIIIRALN
jgi:hypothetical protein